MPNKRTSSTAFFKLSLELKDEVSWFSDQNSNVNLEFWSQFFEASWIKCEEFADRINQSFLAGCFSKKADYGRIDEKFRFWIAIKQKIFDSVLKSTWLRLMSASVRLFHSASLLHCLKGGVFFAEVFFLIFLMFFPL